MPFNVYEDTDVDKFLLMSDVMGMEVLRSDVLHEKEEASDAEEEGSVRFQGSEEVKGLEENVFRERWGYCRQPVRGWEESCTLESDSSCSLTHKTFGFLRHVEISTW